MHSFLHSTKHGSGDPGDIVLKQSCGSHGADILMERGQQ